MGRRCRHSERGATRVHNRSTPSLHFADTLSPPRRNKEDLTPDKLAGVTCVVFAAPQAPLAPSEIAALRAYLSAGGSLLYMSGEGGEPASGTNLNTLTSSYGLTASPDVVIRASFAKYMHPKEALVSSGACASLPFGQAVANIAAGRRGEGALGGADRPGSAMPARVLTAEERRAPGPESVDFVYPRGCTVAVASPPPSTAAAGPMAPPPSSSPSAAAVPLLTTGFVCYPVHRAVGGVAELLPAGGKSPPGRVAVLGSAELFADDWIGKEANAPIADALFRWLIGADRRHAAAVAAAAAAAAAAGRGRAGGALGGSRAPLAPASTDSGAQDADGAIAVLLASVVPPNGGSRSPGSAGAGRASSADVARAARARWSAGRLARGLDDDDEGRRGVGSEDGRERVGVRGASASVTVPDIAALAERVRPCLQETEPLPGDFTKLFDTALFGYR